MKVALKKQMSEIEKIAMEELGLSSIILMENAAIAVTEHCMAYLRGFDRPRVMVIAGKGNNGGDGLAVARHLYMHGISVGVIFIGSETDATPNTRVNLEIAKKLDIPIEYIPLSDTLLDIPYSIETCDLVVDAIIGYGLSGNLDGIYEYIVEMVNNYGKHVIAIDVPSGVNPDTGQVMGIAVKAHKTVTLGYGKTGLYLYPGSEYAGEIVLEKICIPPFMEDKVAMECEVLTDEEAFALLPHRAGNSNKGSFGKVYAFAGCDEMPGAAVLATSAVYKGGGGLVKACVTRHVAGVIHNSSKEVITKILPDDNGFLTDDSFREVQEELPSADVILLGPGLGQGESVTKFVMNMLNNADAYMVIDADALNAIASNVDMLKSLKSPAVVTPHPGEMSRLTGIPVADILKDTITVARDFARRYKVVTVLKDARTIVASPSGDICINTTGTSAMAKAGSGDVLTGLIAAFAAQGNDLFTSCMLANYIHGKAGELAAKKLSEYGVNASDLLENIPKVMLSLGKKHVKARKPGGLQNEIFAL